MKKIISIFLLSTILFLSGCGFLEETQNTINYATEATEYLNELSTFAEEIQSSFDGNVNEQELENMLTDIEGMAEQFNTIEVPAIAESVHHNLVEKNEKLIQTIDHIQENGEVAIEEIKNTELFKTIDSITNLMNQIEQLGFE
ncbi:DUF6376 family protein [Ornithinibacillus halotolerans]|uniref:Lipoprotein n=1 Tax=Ornithinibacillus halotolerans TaxID=1274357 RepID=A0A916S5A0_9BACI|nr:DUF6376 family protein [Ornithinibacillus halotolerans]GGA85163.1 hypothetical protein GCM10008025_30250 [Ornithinibacillus halotolerans]